MYELVFSRTWKKPEFEPTSNHLSFYAGKALIQSEERRTPALRFNFASHHQFFFYLKVKTARLMPNNLEPVQKAPYLPVG